MSNFCNHRISGISQSWGRRFNSCFIAARRCPRTFRPNCCRPRHSFFHLMRYSLALQPRPASETPRRQRRTHSPQSGFCGRAGPIMFGRTAALLIVHECFSRLRGGKTGAVARITRDAAHRPSGGWWTVPEWPIDRIPVARDARSMGAKIQQPPRGHRSRPTPRVGGAWARRNSPSVGAKVNAVAPLYDSPAHILAREGLPVSVAHLAHHPEECVVRRLLQLPRVRIPPPPPISNTLI